VVGAKGGWGGELKSSKRVGVVVPIVIIEEEEDWDYDADGFGDFDIA